MQTICRAINKGDLRICFPHLMKVARSVRWNASGNRLPNNLTVHSVRFKCTSYKYHHIVCWMTYIHPPNLYFSYRFCLRCKQWCTKTTRCTSVTCDLTVHNAYQRALMWPCTGCMSLLRHSVELFRGKVLHTGRNGALICHIRLSSYVENKQVCPLIIQAVGRATKIYHHCSLLE